jgi:quinol monooxygenase YgiN
MICVIATIETAPGRRNDLLAIMRGLVPKVRAEQGCLEYTPMIDLPSDLAGPGRDNAVTMIEKWESLAALEAHLKTPHMGDFRHQSEPLGLKLSLQIVQPA